MILKKYNQFVNESVNTFNFRDLFLRLTEYTVPAGYEETLEPILKEYVPNIKRDEIGNYYVEIGKSNTLFTSHLDTFSKKRKKINHVFDGDYIKTDGKSVLGGDNKNGVVILLYLIHMNVPGTYYFFLGEESIVNKVGCWGSTNALKNNPDRFTNFTKAIAFDRRGKGSFVKRQGGRNCASDMFADAVIGAFAENGLEFNKDNAYRTDSAIFIDVIPEITNLSSGGEYEHTFMESTDIVYLEKVAKAASKIKWDELPIGREIVKLNNNPFEEMKLTKQENDLTTKTFNMVSKLMLAKGYACLNRDDFAPNKVMLFDKYLKEEPVKLKIIGDNIECLDGHKFIGKFRKGNFVEFKRRLRLKLKNLSRGIWLETSKRMDENDVISKEEFKEVLSLYDVEYEEFKNFMLESDEKDFIEFHDDFIKLNIEILHQGLKKKQQEQQQNVNIKN